MKKEGDCNVDRVNNPPKKGLAGTGRKSIERVLLLEAAPAVVLLLPLSCLVCGFC